MSVISIPIVNKLYQIGCVNGQEERIINLGKFVDSKARDILDKMGPLQENVLLSTLCIVLADEIISLSENNIKEKDLEDILAKIKHIRNKLINS